MGLPEPVVDPKVVAYAKEALLWLFLGIIGLLGRVLHLNTKKLKRANTPTAADEEDDRADDSKEPGVAMQRHAAIHRHIGAVRRENTENVKRLRDEHDELKVRFEQHMTEVQKTMERIVRVERDLDAVTREQSHAREDRERDRDEFMRVVEQVRSSIENVRVSMDKLSGIAYRALGANVGEGGH